MKGKLLTKEEFIKKFEKIHGSSFTYEKLEYINNVSKIILTCKKHGDFETFPYKVLSINSFHGCNECKREKSFKNFLNTAIAKTNNRFEYDFSSYVNTYSNYELLIFCKKHKIQFKCSPRSHLQLVYNGCPECKKELNKEYFLKQLNGYRLNYDYSQMNFNDLSTTIKIICKEHGEFFQTPSYFLTQRGICPKCALVKKGKVFINKAIEKHKTRFSYDKFEYTGSDREGIITCNEHGDFKQIPSWHLKAKEPCPQCRGLYGETTEDFIKKAKFIHEDQYDYSLVKYHNKLTAVQLICKYHGSFWVTPKRHINDKTGCPKCNNGQQVSKHEIEWLNKLMVPIRTHKVENYNVDGYNPDTKTIYEFLGDYWHGNLKIYKVDDINKTNKKTYGELNRITFERLIFLKSKGYNVIYIWESEWLENKPYTIL